MLRMMQRRDQLSEIAALSEPQNPGAGRVVAIGGVRLGSRVPESSRGRRDRQAVTDVRRSARTTAPLAGVHRQWTPEPPTIKLRPVPGPPSSTKVCQKCKVRKPRAEFLVAAGDTEDPEVSLFCEICRTTLQTCLKCGIDKPVCEFTHQSSRHGHCKACWAARRRNVAPGAALGRTLQNYYDRIPDAERLGAASRERIEHALQHWSDQDPDEGLKRTKRRRAERLRAAPRQRIDRQMIFERDGWICGICREVVNPEDATLDHIVPVAFGGGHTAANLRLAHGICNSRRQADTPSWLFPSA
jgi:5-methylcytosine-specific restriction endonuclease McrA